MSLKLDALLNPAPKSPERRSSEREVTRPASSEHRPETTLFEAADALTALANYGGHQQHAPSYHSNGYDQGARRQSSYGPQSIATPISSSHSDRAQYRSPTLEQYHHFSRSPEEQRRQSVQSMPPQRSPIILPPLANLTSPPTGGMNGYQNGYYHQQQVPPNYGHDKMYAGMPEYPRRSVDYSAYGYGRQEPAIANAGVPPQHPHAPYGTGLGLSFEQSNVNQEHVKSEVSETPHHPMDSTEPASGEQQREENMDSETLKAIEAIQKQERGLRTQREAPKYTITEEMKNATALAGPRKRAAPKNSTAPGKKGSTSTSKKPASKKRKLDVDTASANSQPNERRSGTPASRASKTPAAKGPKKSQSNTPMAGSSPAPADPSAFEGAASESEDDDAIYCICQGKDDHTWMLGCEACDGWFHGRCVNLNKDDHEMLLAKFICPLCEEAGRGHTTWKPMCRRAGCTKPAEVIAETKTVDGKKTDNTTRSKYCSPGCGQDFFKNIVAATSSKAGNKSQTKKKSTSSRRKSNFTDNNDAHEEISDDESTRGGLLRGRDLKSLLAVCESEAAFHNLGTGVLSPPETMSPANSANNDSDPKASYHLVSAESDRLSEVDAEKGSLRVRRALLKDRERFINIAKGEATKYAEKENLKAKEVCGFDYRLAWSDEEFDIWRTSRNGRAALSNNTFSPSPEQIAAVDSNEIQESPHVSVSDASAVEELINSSNQLCTKKRCERHKNWQKFLLQDLRVEDMDIQHAIKKVEAEEQEIRERATTRWRREKAAEGMQDNPHQGEGWVQAVEA